MNQRKHVLRRALALLLCVSALGGLPALAPKTEATDMEIDGSGFTNPEKTSGYMYRWHEGAPPNSADYRTLLEQGKLPAKYPILLTWDGKYYLNTGTAFSQRFTERYNKPELLVQYLEAGAIVGGYNPVTAVYTFLFGSGGDKAEMTGYEELHDVRNHDGYRIDMDKSGLLANVSFYNDLRTRGSAVCMDVGMPEMPFLVPVNRGNLLQKDYLLGTPRVADGGALDYEENWLTLQTWLWSAAIDNSEQKDWGLGALHMDEETLLNSQLAAGGGYGPSSQPATYTNPIDMSFLWDELKRLSPELDAAQADPNSKFSLFYKFGPNSASFTMDSANWLLHKMSGDNVYTLSTDRSIYAYMILDKGFRPTSDWDNELLTESQMMFRHDKGKLILDRYTTSDYDKTDHQFSIYYAEPVITSFMQSSFTVQKGQVVTLDGPIVIGPNCVVTVEDGGVLSCTGWIINNGQIMIESGGTMIVQSKTDTTTEFIDGMEVPVVGVQTYGVVNSYGAAADSSSGRIACDGTLIVMSGCKVIGGGNYGLQFGAGAQVVNYGQLISENFEVYAKNTIENRGDTSAVFLGWGITDSGYDLTQSLIGSGTIWPGKGTRQSAAIVKMPLGAVYGEGKDRVYTMSGRSFDADVAFFGKDKFQIVHVTYEKTAPRKGYVASLHAVLVTPPPGEVPSPTPEPVPLINDPDAVTKNLNFDRAFDVFWFTGKDGLEYYYEARFGSYIHIDNNLRYHYCPENVVPPPGTSLAYLYPARSLALQVIFYSGMEEYVEPSPTPTPTPVPTPPDTVPVFKPKVQFSGGDYFVVSNGRQYTWNRFYRYFLPQSCTWVNGVPQDAFRPEDVDLNGYTLPG